MARSRCWPTAWETTTRRRFTGNCTRLGRGDLPVEQICLALGDSALLTFPGELYTEIGQYIKAHSPFRRTFVIGLANGYVGYIPTQGPSKKAAMRKIPAGLHAAAERLVVAQTLALLDSVYRTAVG